VLTRPNPEPHHEASLKPVSLPKPHIYQQIDQFGFKNHIRTTTALQNGPITITVISILFVFVFGFLALWVYFCARGQATAINLEGIVVDIDMQ
jgi:hypothetical protein